MKTTKKTTKPLKRAKTAAHKRREKIRAARPIHKRVLLHPVAFFILLCVGVFLFKLTFTASADSLTVTGSVLAPVPTAAADITFPADNTHFSTVPVNIVGTCPSEGYVQLYRNNNFSGIASCGPGDSTYQIVTNLTPGSNDLYTRMFNITDNEGPSSAHITLWYDKIEDPVVPPIIPTVTPTSLIVLTAENNRYIKGYYPEVSAYPTVTGLAPPNSLVRIEYRSLPVVCSTYSDSSGHWSCSLNEELSLGWHEVYITSTATDGSVLSLPVWKAHVVGYLTPLHRSATITQPFYLTSNYHYQVFSSGKSVDLDFSIKGGAAPYAVTVHWGDGKDSTVVIKDGSVFRISHTYKLSGSILQTFKVGVEATDINNSKSTLQVIALVRGVGLAASTINGAGLSLFSQAKGWIWIIWPAYLIVALMSVSFWLGERQQSLKLVIKSQRRKPRHA